MAEYTYADIIMDPNDPRLEGAIGKKVYSSADINLLLHRANNDEHEMTLTQVEDVDSDPFTVTDMNEHDFDADFIIIKNEEPKSHYEPFASIEEFLTDYFKSVANSEYIQKTISSTGIWLKHNDAFLLVVEIWDRGVVIGDINMQTTEIDEDEYITVHGVTKWKELLEDYTFLDGSPCGKEVK